MVIPHVPAQPKIQNASRQKFDRRYGKRAKRGTQKKIPRGKVLIDQANGNEAHAAADRHAPMGMPTVEDLNAVVCRSTHGGDEGIFQDRGKPFPRQSLCIHGITSFW